VELEEREETDYDDFSSGFFFAYFPYSVRIKGGL
jgi:hypothetical protein